MTREIVISVVSPPAMRHHLLRPITPASCCSWWASLRTRSARRPVCVGGGGCCHGLGDATLLLTAQFGLLSVKYGLKMVLQGNHSCLYRHIGIFFAI